MDTKQITNEMRYKGFNPNTLITLPAVRYSRLDDVRECYLHTLRVLHRRVYGRYDKTKIKHMGVCETGHSTNLNPHIHALVLFDTDKLPLAEWMLEIRDIWMNTRTGSGFRLNTDLQYAKESWFKDIHDLDGIVSYCFKYADGDGDNYLYAGQEY
jgi:hypothetical protein